MTQPDATGDHKEDFTPKRCCRMEFSGTSRQISVSCSLKVEFVHREIRSCANQSEGQAGTATSKCALNRLPCVSDIRSPSMAKVKRLKGPSNVASMMAARAVTRRSECLIRAARTPRESPSHA